nr:hypothetical protein [Tanacetum cinerariifolium]
CSAPCAPAAAGRRARSGRCYCPGPRRRGARPGPAPRHRRGGRRPARRLAGACRWHPGRARFRLPHSGRAAGARARRCGSGGRRGAAGCQTSPAHPSFAARGPPRGQCAPGSGGLPAPAPSRCGRSWCCRAS